MKKTIKKTKKTLKKAKEMVSLETAANMLTYRVQDLLDGFSHGGSFNFKQFELNTLRLLKIVEK